jgi:site-specific recombinase XerD
MFQAEWKETRKLNLSDQCRQILTAGIANSTNKQYHLYLKKFKEFCTNRSVSNYLEADLTTGIEFLSSLFQDGHSYSSINTARSSISHFVQLNNSTIDFGKHPVTVRFMRGIFKLRKPVPKYKSTWDVNQVLTVLKSWDNESCSLKTLSLKTVMLVALSTGQRTQTLSELKLSQLSFSNHKLVFTFDTPLKTTRPGHDYVMELSTFSDSTLCPVTAVKEYMARTETVRGDVDHLFLSFQKPHGKVTSQTIARWLSLSLRQAGIMDLFTAHSTRSASSSKAASKTDINLVLKVGGWSNAKTFAHFYNRSIASDNSCFSNAVLS